MQTLKKISYYLHPDDDQPQPGQFLVTVTRRKQGKKPLKYDGVLSVIRIKSVRKIQHKRVLDSQGYALELNDHPELKPLTVVERLVEGMLVWVRGEEALPCFWIPRGKPG